MFDVGWSEMFLIMAVAVLVIGPDEIPKVMMTLGRVVRRLNYMRFALTQQFEDMMKEAGLNPEDMHMRVNFEAQKYDKQRDAPEFDEAAADEEGIEDNREEAKERRKMV